MVKVVSIEFVMRNNGKSEAIATMMGPGIILCMSESSPERVSTESGRW
jgi:hypothetical protein